MRSLDFWLSVLGVTAIAVLGGLACLPALKRLYRDLYPDDEWQ
jgi:hypothetical protein